MTYQRPGVYISETLLSAGAGTAIGGADAAGAALGVFAQGPTVVTRVTSWYEFVKNFGGNNANYPATFGVKSFFDNGGTDLYVRRVLHNDASAAYTTVPHTSGGSDVMATITAKNLGMDGTNLRIQFTATRTNYFDLTVYKETVAGTASNTSNDIVLERFTNVRIDDTTSPDYVENVVNLTSNYITVAVSDNTKTPTTAVLPLVGSGLDGSTVTATDIAGAVSDFDVIDRPLVVFAPEIIAQLGDSDAQTVQSALIAWANAGNGFAVLDTPAITTASTAITDAETYVSGLSASTNGAAAVYFPNFYIVDPLGRSAQALRKIGPAGAIAGLYLATDRRVGPWKAPAGIQSTIRGAVALEQALTSSQLDTLNSGSLAINALRNLPGAGIVSMGARTLLQDGTANKYVNMRRSLIHIEKLLKDATQFAIFENNNQALWSRLQATLGNILNGYFNQGGLRGGNASQAFFIKVDAENNPPEVIANGEVHIEVGVALQYPAEFVVISLSQKTGN